MPKRMDAALIGAFIIGALVLTAVAVVLWGSGRLFRDTARYVCYFDGSVEGLEVGAPVKASGVAVGKVVRIQLHYRQQPNDERIPVFIELDLERLVWLGTDRPNPRLLAEAEARGLRARLEPQGLVTGTLFVNFGFYPRSSVRLAELDPENGTPEIPTAPRQLAQIGDSVTDIVARLERVDFAAMARAFTAAAASVDRLASTSKVPETLDAVTSSLSSYRKLGRELEVELPPLLADLRLTVGGVRRTLGGLDGAAGAASRLVAPEAPLSLRMGAALDEVSRAASAVRDLADYLQRNPNSLLVGKGR
jgi:paraquat-inducible protein B